MDRWLDLAGRWLLAGLFAAGAVQKAVAPGQVERLLLDSGLPDWFVWPALTFNAAGAVALILGVARRPVGVALALYCMATSWFHFLPDDGWQMSIVVKNWAIAGGLLVYASGSRRGAI